MKKGFPVRYFCLFLLLLNTFNTFSQSAATFGDTASYPYWVTMMQDRKVPFRATQSAFYKYWSDRPTDVKGNGYKVFKRWEYINESRILPDGKLQPADYVLSVYQNDIAPLVNSRSSNGNWSVVGPTLYPTNNTVQPTGMGRVNAIAFHPTDPNVIFVGAPAGGIWKSADNGATWISLSSNLPTLGVSSIVVHPTDGNTIFLGTGDRDSDDAPGLGVYKTTNGGVTWASSSSGMDAGTTVAALAMHPFNANILVASTNTGLYKSTDGGASWSRKLTSTLWKDVKFNPGNPTIVYATWNGTFYRSTNTGDNWSAVTLPALPSSSSNRVAIGVSPANSSYVYLVISRSDSKFNAVLRSTDSGATFSVMATTPNIFDYECDGSGTSGQGFYDLCIAVDQTDANIVYVGSVNNWKSTDGGTTWNIASHWVGNMYSVACAASVHADQHAYAWSPWTSNKLFVGHDGGISYTTNGGTSWTEISSGLEIAQFYKLGQSATNASLTVCGAQDNGGAARSGTAFFTERAGDGMESAIDPTDNNYRYYAAQNGSIRRNTGGTGGSFSTIANNGTNGVDEAGNWVTPYLLHKTIPSTMFIGYKNVWRSTNIKATSASSVTWSKISTGETANCIAVEQSTANNDILYVVRSNQIKRTDNANASAGSVTWTTCNLPGGTYTPTDLKTHPTNPDIVYASANYGVYKSTDRGITWTSISGSLPALFTNCLAYDPNSNEGLYVGNQTGVWYRDASLSDWVNFSTGLPTVDVRELEIYTDANPINSRIVAATYGRGLWQSDLYVTVLPVELSSFTAQCRRNEVAIDWTTRSEKDNARFTVEWSLNAFDWHPLAEKAAAGNSNQTTRYQVAAAAPAAEQCYYRLRQTDSDGKSTFSQVVTLQCDQQQSIVRIFPNPTEGRFTVESSAGDLLSVRIFNAVGQMVLEQEVSASTTSFDLNALLPGIYAVEASTTRGATVQRLVVRK